MDARYCKKCGELLNGLSRTCPVCGATQEDADTTRQAASLNPTHTRQRDCAHEGHVAGASQSVSFPEAMKLFFARYADFKGRSRRSEYWWAVLGIGILGSVIGEVLPDLAWIWTLAVLIPGLALCVRRLHDTGRSGWYYLFILLPVVGQILLLIWFCGDSTGTNRWGPNPKA